MTRVLHRACLCFTREFQAGQWTILEVKKSWVSFLTLLTADTCWTFWTTKPRHVKLHAGIWAILLHLLLHTSRAFIIKGSHKVHNKQVSLSCRHPQVGVLLISKLKLQCELMLCTETMAAMLLCTADWLTSHNMFGNWPKHSTANQKAYEAENLKSDFLQEVVAKWTNPTSTAARH